MDLVIHNAATIVTALIDGRAINVLCLIVNVVIQICIVHLGSYADLSSYLNRL